MLCLLEMGTSPPAVYEHIKMSAFPLVGGGILAEEWENGKDPHSGVNQVLQMILASPSSPPSQTRCLTVIYVLDHPPGQPLAKQLICERLSMRRLSRSLKPVSLANMSEQFSKV